ncbi:MAG TPA: hypothetical protein ENN44_02960 [Methanoculleus sp.]|nr:hypothetical protein [Methanoculleus sp.]
MILLTCTGAAAAQDTGGEYYALLFSSNGCGSCGPADMYVFTNLTQQYPELVVVDYELSGHPVNGMVNRKFSELYGVSQSVPHVILGENLTFLGRNAIVTAIAPILDAQRNGTPPASGSLLRFATLDLSSLEGYPKIWRANRVLIFEDGGADAAFLKEVITTPNINTALSGRQYEVISPPPIRVGKQNITFEHAVRVEGWVVQWNSVDMPSDANNSVATPLSVWGAVCAMAAVAAAGMRR